MVMDSSDLKDLAKIIDLCRKKGVSELKFDGVEIKLAPEKPASDYKKRKKTEDTKEDLGPAYTDEETLFWSSDGIPDEAQQQ